MRIRTVLPLIAISLAGASSYLAAQTLTANPTSLTLSARVGGSADTKQLSISAPANAAVQFAIFSEHENSVAIQRGRAARPVAAVLLHPAGQRRSPQGFAIAAVQAEYRAIAALHALHIDAIASDGKRPVAFAQTGNGPNLRRAAHRPRLGEAGLARNSRAVRPAPLWPFERAVRRRESAPWQKGCGEQR